MGQTGSLPANGPDTPSFGSEPWRQSGPSRVEKIKQQLSQVTSIVRHFIGKFGKMCLACTHPRGACGAAGSTPIVRHIRYVMSGSYSGYAVPGVANDVIKDDEEDSSEKKPNNDKSVWGGVEEEESSSTGQQSLSNVIDVPPQGSPGSSRLTHPLGTRACEARVAISGGRRQSDVGREAGREAGPEERGGDRAEGGLGEGRGEGRGGEEESGGAAEGRAV
eukprot:362702-Rhodomonas_salina.3